MCDGTHIIAHSREQSDGQKTNCVAWKRRGGGALEEASHFFAQSPPPPPPPLARFLDALVHKNNVVTQYPQIL